MGRVLARLVTFAIDGFDPHQVWVEVDIRSGLPTFTIVGLGDIAVRESRDRIRAAVQNSGFKFPKTRIAPGRYRFTLTLSAPVNRGEPRVLSSKPLIVR